MMLPNTAVVHNPRMGGSVVRYHTWPTIQRQTVADHTFHVIRIYHSVFGDVPPEVTAYLVYHDIPEVATGDDPHPVKARNPVLKAEKDRLEHEALVAMIGESMAEHIDGSVTDAERVKMKCADLLEMGEFALVEWTLGNRFADAIVVNVFAGLQYCTQVLHPRERADVFEYLTNEMERYRYTNAREIIRTYYNG